jgi:hypothetical protein
VDHVHVGEGDEAMRAARLLLAFVLLMGPTVRAPGAAANERPLFYAQLHHGAGRGAGLPAEEVVDLLENAGVRRALVSAAREEDLRALLVAGSHIVAPELHPYRRRSELMTWFEDPGVPARLAERAARLPYVALGALHLYGAQVELPVVRATLAIARRRGLLLHVQADTDAIDRIFRLWPEARVLWAHAGFAPVEEVSATLRRHARLWCDLGRRADLLDGEQVTPAWLALLEAFPDRFVLGFDPAPNDHWHRLALDAARARTWLATLPDDIATRLAWKNGVQLLEAVSPARDRADR